MKKSPFHSTYLFLVILLSLSFLFNACSEDPDPDPPRTCEVLGGDITTTTTLVDINDDPNFPDYCVNERIYLEENAGLIIEPGVVIEFASNTGIDLGRGGTQTGYIKAEGSSSKPIIFTGETKTPGSWRGIYVNYTSNDVRNLLDHCVIEYAGSEELASFSAGAGYKAALGVGHSTAGPTGLISLTNSTIRFTNGKGYACKQDGGLNNFSNNHFESNSEEAIFMSLDGFEKVDGNTTFLNNGVDGVSQNNGTNGYFDASTNHTFKALSDGNYYHLHQGIRIMNGGLRLEPGVKMIVADGKRIQVDDDAYLKAEGTSGKPIIIRGVTLGTPSWNSIYFKSLNTQNQLTHCVISEAGIGTIASSGCDGAASIGLFYWSGTGSSVTMNKCTLVDGDGCGIFTDTDNLANLSETETTYTRLGGSNICN